MSELRFNFVPGDEDTYLVGAKVKPREWLNDDWTIIDSLVKCIRERFFQFKDIFYPDHGWDHLPHTH